MGEQVHGALHAAALQVAVRRLAERRADDPAVAVTGVAPRRVTIAVRAKPLAWMIGASGPRSVPLDGRRRTETRAGCPSGYARANVTSTRPFATATGRTRSPVGGGATGA